MKVALIQLDIRWRNKVENQARASVLIEQAAREKCQLAVLPEMFTTGFHVDAESREDAEALLGPTHQFLTDVARKHSIALVAGYSTNDQRNPEKVARNTAVFIDGAGEHLGSYAKLHLFSFAGEHKFIEAGDRLGSFELGDLRAGVAVCFDLRFPELFRALATRVNCLIVIANWPKTRDAHWQALLRARAIENQCFVLGVNRIGTDGKGLQYCGSSSVYSPLGEAIRVGGPEEEIIFAEIDLSSVAQVRRQFPFLSDIRFPAVVDLPK